MPCTECVGAGISSVVMYGVWDVSSNTPSHQLHWDVQIVCDGTRGHRLDGVYSLMLHVT